jgi:hypothetical protein
MDCFGDVVMSAVCGPRAARLGSATRKRSRAIAAMRTGPNPTRERFIPTMDDFSFNTGGFTVRYTPDDHSGSNFVESTVITKEGRFLR